MNKLLNEMFLKYNGRCNFFGLDIALSVISTVATVAVSVYSGYAQAKQEKAMGKAQQRMANYNASVLDVQADAERQSGNATLRDARIRGEQIRDKHRYVKGAQQAALAKSGVVAGAGTPLLVASEEAMRGKLSVMDEIWKGKMAKREFDIRAGYFDAQAAGERMRGDWAKRAGDENAKSSILSGWISGGTALLGGGAEFGGKMYKRSQDNKKIVV